MFGRLTRRCCVTRCVVCRAESCVYERTESCVYRGAQQVKSVSLNETNHHFPIRVSESPWRHRTTTPAVTSVYVTEACIVIAVHGVPLEEGWFWLSSLNKKLKDKNACSVRTHFQYKLRKRTSKFTSHNIPSTSGIIKKSWWRFTAELSHFPDTSPTGEDSFRLMSITQQQLEIKTCYWYFHNLAVGSMMAVWSDLIGKIKLKGIKWSPAGIRRRSRRWKLQLLRFHFPCRPKID